MECLILTAAGQLSQETLPSRRCRACCIRARWQSINEDNSTRAVTRAREHARSPLPALSVSLLFQKYTNCFCTRKQPGNLIARGVYSKYELARLDIVRKQRLKGATKLGARGERASNCRRRRGQHLVYFNRGSTCSRDCFVSQHHDV